MLSQTLREHVVFSQNNNHVFLIAVTNIGCSEWQDKGSIGLLRTPLERVIENIHYMHTMLLSNCFVAFFSREVSRILGK